jgi:hypothetical protein
LDVVTVRKVRPCPAAGPRVPPGAEAVADASDTKHHLSATPPTLIGDVDGAGDRPRILALA